MDVINEKYFLEPEDKFEYDSNKLYTEISKSVYIWNIPRLLWNVYTDLLIPVVIISTI